MKKKCKLKKEMKRCVRIITNEEFINKEMSFK